jgi:uncharacterized membrane protein YhhN
MEAGERMMLVATIVCACACVALVGAEYRHAKVARSIAKPIASLAFIAVGVLAMHGAGTEGFQRHIVLGLVLGAIGDVALLGASNRAFLAGLVAFLLGHLAYAIACIHLVGPGETLGLAGIAAALPVAAGIGALAWLWPRLGTMRVPVILYVATIIAMVVAAIAAARSDALPPRNGQLLAAGAVLFFASDLAVARDKFVEKSFWNRAWGLPAYYAGQLLIAWSLSS